MHASSNQAEKNRQIKQALVKQVKTDDFSHTKKCSRYCDAHSYRLLATNYYTPHTLEMWTTIWRIYYDMGYRLLCTRYFRYMGYNVLAISYSMHSIQYNNSLEANTCTFSHRCNSRPNKTPVHSCYIKNTCTYRTGCNRTPEINNCTYCIRCSSSSVSNTCTQNIRCNSSPETNTCTHCIGDGFWNAIQLILYVQVLVAGLLFDL